MRDRKAPTNQLCVMLPAHAEVWNGRFEHIGLRVPLERDERRPVDCEASTSSPGG